MTNMINILDSIFQSNIKFIGIIIIIIALAMRYLETNIILIIFGIIYIFVNNVVMLFINNIFVFQI